MSETTALTRRRFLQRSVTTGAGAALAGGMLGRSLASPAAAAAGVIPLPNAAQVQREFQRMVDFGPRITGSKAHDDFLVWLDRELRQAGVKMLPRFYEDEELWEIGHYGLDVLDGAAKGTVPIAAYQPRCKETDDAGLTAPLVYAGTAPSPTLSPDAGSLAASFANYPEQLASWATAVGANGSLDGAIAVVDVPVPAPLTEGAFVGMANYVYFPGHTEADLTLRDYRRLWIVAAPSDPFVSQGAKGVVFIFDASFEALKGDHAPFSGEGGPVPTLYVDRDTGAKLRTAAAGKPKARLTLTATRRRVKSPSLLGVLPGRSREAIVLNTHTDGQNFVEENGGVAMVQMARHFASLPADQRLERSLVFSLVTGHVGHQEFAQTEGFIERHPDIAASTAAAITIEHLGCTEWQDTADKGYHATGSAEGFGIWTSQTALKDLVIDLVPKHDIQHAAVLRPPVQFGIGGAFQDSGIPQVGALAGPNYLVSIVDNGHIDKLDANLAARQIAFFTELVKRIDKTPAEPLRSGDPMLDAKPIAPGPDYSTMPEDPPLGRARLRVALDRTSAKRAQRTKRVPATVGLDRPGAVQLKGRMRSGKRVHPFGRRVVRFKQPGRRRVSLRLSEGATRRLAERGPLRVRLTARYSDPAGTVVRRVSRLLRRR